MPFGICLPRNEQGHYEEYETRNLYHHQLPVRCFLFSKNSSRNRFGVSKLYCVFVARCPTKSAASYTNRSYRSVEHPFLTFENALRSYCAHVQSVGHPLPKIAATP
jgi:hypothetical protein